jgi:hypothetical protein
VPAAPPIEELLVQAGLTTAGDLERARRHMRGRGGGLLANLLALGRVDDVHLARTLAKRLGLPLAEPAALDRVAAPRTPSRRHALRALAIEKVLLPIAARQTPRQVDVAMFDPFDHEAMARLGAICGGAEVCVKIAPRRQLLDAIARTFGREQSGVLGERPRPVEFVEFTDVHDDARRRGEGAAGDGDAAALAQTLGAEPLDPELDSVPDFDSVPELERTPRVMLVPPPTDVLAGDLGGEGRLNRVLLEVSSLALDLLEERATRGVRLGQDLGRAVRAVATALGYDPTAVAEVGLAAQIVAAEQALYAEAVHNGARTAPRFAEALGWAAGAPGGIGPILRAMAPDRPPRPLSDPLPQGARIIVAVREVLRLSAAVPDGQLDRETVNQLLRVTTPPEIMQAIFAALLGSASPAEPEVDKERPHVG